MKLCVMACYDKKAKAFSNPFYVTHQELAVRTFKQAANTPEHSVCLYPEDHALFYFGTFDDENGLFNLCSIPTHVVEAINLKKGLGNNV